MGKIRINDIADKAGVSPATVSNALNGKKGVSLLNAEKIRSIAADLGYESAVSTPGMEKQNSIRIVVVKKHGLVVMDTQFFTELLEAVSQECRHRGMDLLVTHLNLQQEPEWYKRVDEICQEECAGIILLATELLDDDLRLFEHTRSPLVVLDNFAPGFHYNSVVMDNREAGTLAARCLIENGHTHIGLITSSADFYNMRDREAGWRDCLSAHELTPGMVIHLTPTIEGAYMDMCEFLDKNQETLPSAFFAANDILAVGAIRALKQHGFRIPDDVSMIGMDDLQICHITNPKLSTIRVFRTDLAQIAVESLFTSEQRERLHGVMKTLLSVELVERDSVRKIETEPVLCESAQFH